MIVIITIILMRQPLRISSAPRLGELRKGSSNIPPLHMGRPIYIYTYSFACTFLHANHHDSPHPYHYYPHDHYHLLGCSIGNAEGATMIVAIPVIILILTIITISYEAALGNAEDAAMIVLGCDDSFHHHRHPYHHPRGHHHLPDNHHGSHHHQ